MRSMSRSGVIWIKLLDDLLDGDLATVILVDRFVDLGNRQGVDPGLEVANDTLGELPALVAIEPGLDRGPRVLELASQASPGDGGRSTRAFAFATARTRTMLRLSSPAMRRTRRSESREQDQRHARQPEDRQGHPDEPERHPPDTHETPERTGWRARPDRRVLELFEGDLMKDEPKRQRGHQVDHEVAGEIGHPVGGERQLEGKLEEEHRADGQIRPGEELVLPDREP